MIAGAEIAKRTGLKSGMLYPALFRLERAEWLQSKWEEGVPQDLGKRRHSPSVRAERNCSATIAGQNQFGTDQDLSGGDTLRRGRWIESGIERDISSAFSLRSFLNWFRISG